MERPGLGERQTGPRGPIEEQALVRGLGPAYSEYMRRTWRFIPYVF